MGFQFKIEERKGALICFLAGRLFQEDDAKAVFDGIDLELQTKAKHVIFQLEELTHCNSSGLNVFMRTLTKTRVKGGDTYVCAMNEQLKQLFTIAKIDEIFSIQANVEDALQLINKAE